MASLSDTLVASNAPPVEGIASSIQEGMKAGIGLATAKEQIEGAKVKLEDDKANLVLKQATTANSLLTNLARANPAVGKMMLKQVREKLLNLGVDPEIANYTISDDANRQRQIAFSQYAGGALTSDKEMAAQYFQELGSVVGYDKAAQMYDNELKNQHEMAKQNKLLAASERIANIKTEKSSDASDAKIDKETRGALTKANDKFKSEMKKETDALTSMQSAADLISQGGVSASAGRRALAKAFNSGAMTDQDVADIAGGKSLLQKGAQLAETAMSGDLTPDNEKELLNIVNTLIPVMQKKIKDRADVAADSFSNIYKNVPKSDVLKILNPFGLGGAGIKSSDQEMRDFFKKNNIPPEAQAAAGAAFIKSKAKKQQVRN